MKKLSERITPGPWKILFKDNNTADITSSCEWKWDIANIHGKISHSKDGMGPIAEANAKLIQHCPEMLSILERLAAEYPSWEVRANHFEILSKDAEKLLNKLNS